MCTFQSIFLYFSMKYVFMNQQPTRLFDFAQYQLDHFPLQEAYEMKYQGLWQSISSAEFMQQAHAVSRALLRLGVKKNDKIAVISLTNRTEWNILDVGIMQIGAQNVPIYPTITEEDYAYILNHSESKYCFVSCAIVYEKIKAIRAQTSLVEVYSFNQLADCSHFSSLLQLGADQSNQKEVEALAKGVLPEDLATIIYTSGTTGKPKGVMLSHHNVVSNVLYACERLPLVPGQAKALSFLPICHIFERVITYIYQYTGVKVCYAESLETLMADLQRHKPDVMTSVPRLLEKVFDSIVAKGAVLTGIKKALFFWALDLGLRYEPYGKNGAWYEFQLKIADRLIFSKWRAALGGNLRLIASGSAALQPRLARVFNAARMGVMEGYGLTETSPVVSVNDMRDGKFRIGTVGKLIAETEVKIAEDGEILVKGPQVMMGYYKDPELTASVIQHGYFHTGDIGHIDEDGFLRITDRKKEMFKTSGGKYVAPQLLENRLKQSRFIEQVMVVGDGEKMPAALIQPDFAFLEQWAQKKELGDLDRNALIAHPRVLSRIEREVESANEQFAKFEKIKQFKLTPDAWTPDSGHLTPTMKLKRKAIQAKYQDLYDQIYR